MKYFPLVWAALMRRKPRTILTMLSIAVAFLLYGLLQGVLAAFTAGIDIAGADRLITTGKYSFTQLQPVAYANQIRAVPGIKEVAYQSWFGGIYQTEANFFAQFPSDVEPYLRLYPEVLLPEDQKQALLKTRTGAVVLKRLADKYGWKVGDKVPIISTIWPKKDGSNVWEFDLVGIFDCKDGATRAQHEYLLFHHEYFEEARAFGQGRVGWFIERTEDPSRNAEIALAIDQRFANSPGPTKTDSEKAFNQGFVKQFGNLQLILGGIMTAVIFTLLMLTGNTMMQSVRERIPELAVLKTLGYADGTVLALVLVEALILCGVAAAIGIGLAMWAAPVIGAGIPFPGFTGMKVGAGAVALGAAIAAGLALMVGLPPALRAMRLDIVNALSGH
ncbi:MAG: ABC transporter permease [Nevskiaceae bacterium]